MGEDLRLAGSAADRFDGNHQFDLSYPGALSRNAPCHATMLMPGLALLVTRNLTRRKELAWYEDFHRDACLLGRERSARAPHAAGLCRYSQAAKALTQVQL